MMWEGIKGSELYRHPRTWHVGIVTPRGTRFSGGTSDQLVMSDPDPGLVGVNRCAAHSPSVI